MLWKTSTQHLKRKRLVDLFVYEAILTTHSPDWCFTLDTLPSNGHHGSKTKFDSPCTGTTPVISETSRMKNGCLGFLKNSPVPTGYFGMPHIASAKGKNSHLTKLVVVHWRRRVYPGASCRMLQHVASLAPLLSLDTTRFSHGLLLLRREKPVCMSLRSVSFPVDLVNASAEF